MNSRPSQPWADLILKNGNIYTVEPQRRWAESVAIKDGYIIGVGRDDQVAAWQGSTTQVIDLNGKMVLPGLTDHHAHTTLAVSRLFMADLTQGNSLEEYKEIVKHFALSHPDVEVIQGYGWRDALFSEAPRKEWLDELEIDKPIVLISDCYHSRWCNSKALELAGINRDTPTPEGGVIEKDPVTNEPSGTVREMARELVKRIIPDFSVQQYMEAILTFQRWGHERGITAIHEPENPITDGSENKYLAYKKLDEEKRLKTRYTLSLLAEPSGIGIRRLPWFIQLRQSHQSPFFNTKKIKMVMDGVFSGATAFMSKGSYLDSEEHQGLTLWEKEEFNEAVALFDRHSFQIHVHCFGDEATTWVLDGFEYARQVNGPRDSRHEITHLNVVKGEDISRFKALGVIPVFQPSWFYKGGLYETAVQHLGEERAERLFPAKAFVQAGVPIVSSSDYPVSQDFRPLLGIQLGITRRGIDQSDERQVLWAEQGLTLEKMIESYTINAAYANFQEERLGTIQAGKKADLIVLEKNLFEVPTTDLHQVNVLLTMVDGEIVYRHPQFDG